MPINTVEFGDSRKISDVRGSDI